MEWRVRPWRAAIYDRGNAAVLAVAKGSLILMAGESYSEGRAGKLGEPVPPGRPGREDHHGPDDPWSEDVLEPALTAQRGNGPPPGEPEDPGSPAPDDALAEAEAELAPGAPGGPGGPGGSAIGAPQAEQETPSRHEGDQELLRALRASGFEGIVWEYFANELAAYAIPVLMSWTRTGKIVKLCAARGMGIAPPRKWSYQDRSDVAYETIARAIKKFRGTLREEKWVPGRGASIKTYFMGAVIKEFPNSYHLWRNACVRPQDRPGPQALEDMPAVAAIQPPRVRGDPAELVTDAVFVGELLAAMPPELRKAGLMLREGSSVAEAATAIGKTPGALRQQLLRFGGKYRKEGV